MIDSATRFEAARRRGRRVGGTVEVHAEIGSTSDRARELLRAGEEGTAVVAELQTAGRGRRGRTWTSPAGRNLTVSVGLRPRLASTEAWALGPAVALAARRACEAVALVRLKWPNDLVAGDGRKLGGILVETALDGERLVEAIVGIGINVNWPRAEMPAELREGATSLAELAGEEVDRVALLGRLLEALDEELGRLEAGERPLGRYRAACATLGQEVAVTVGAGRVVGRAVALDPTGALVLETPAGEVTLASGEVERVRSVGDR